MDIAGLAQNMRRVLALGSVDGFAVLDLHVDSPGSVDVDLDLEPPSNSPSSEADLDLHATEPVASTGALSGRACGLEATFNEMQRQVGAFVRHSGLDEAAAASHPATTNLAHMMKLAFLSKPPRRDSLQGQSVRAYGEAQSLVWQAMAEQQQEGIKAVFDSIRSNCIGGLDRQESDCRWLFVSRRYDETSMWLQYPAGIRASWLQWLFEELEANRLLSEHDLQQLGGMLAGATHGLGHVLTQRAVLAYGEGGRTHRSQVVIPPCLIQRTSASNLCAALDAFKPLCFQYLLQDVSPYTGFLLVHLGSDHFSSNDRLHRELVDLMDKWQNVGVMAAFCSAHDLGNTCAEAPGIKAIAGKLHQLVNLTRQLEYRDKFLTSMGVCIRLSGPAIRPISPATATGPRQLARDAIRRLMVFTMLREHNISGKREYPGRQYEEDAKIGPLVTDLCRYWHFNVDDFSKIEHLCDFTSCKCSRTNHLGSAVYHLTRTFLACTVYLLPARVPELGKWQTTSEGLAFLVFIVLIGLVGARGWLHRWPTEVNHRVSHSKIGWCVLVGVEPCVFCAGWVRGPVVSQLEVTTRLSSLGHFNHQQDSVRFKVADRLCLENEGNANSFVKENTKRLAGVSSFFHNREQLILCCLQNVVMLPTDWLMRRLDKLDSVAVSRSTHGGIGPVGVPLIYLLVSPESSPVSRALVVLADFLKSDGHLGFILYLWWKHTGSSPEWWHQWALRGFRSLEQHSPDRSHPINRSAFLLCSFYHFWPEGVHCELVFCFLLWGVRFV